MDHPCRSRQDVVLRSSVRRRRQRAGRILVRCRRSVPQVTNSPEATLRLRHAAPHARTSLTQVEGNGLCTRPACRRSQGDAARLDRMFLLKQSTRAPAWGTVTLIRLLVAAILTIASPIVLAAGTHPGDDVAHGLTGSRPPSTMDGVTTFQIDGPLAAAPRRWQNPHGPALACGSASQRALQHDRPCHPRRSRACPSTCCR